LRKSAKKFETVKLPRDVDGWRLVRALEKFGYSFSRQSGSHYTLTTTAKGEHHITVPLHSPIKVGTLSAILKRLAAHHEKSVAEVLKVLDP